MESLVFIPVEGKLAALTDAVSSHTRIVIARDGVPLVAFYRVGPNEATVWNCEANRDFTKEFVSHTWTYMDAAYTPFLTASQKRSRYATDRQILQYIDSYGSMNLSSACFDPFVVIIDNEVASSYPSLEVKNSVIIDNEVASSYPSLEVKNRTTTVRFLLAPFNFTPQQFSESISWESVDISAYLDGRKPLSFEKDLEQIARGLYAFLADNADLYFYKDEVFGDDSTIITLVYIAKSSTESAWSDPRHIFLFIITSHWRMNSAVFRFISA